jgi:hypothetical protein
LAALRRSRWGDIDKSPVVGKVMSGAHAAFLLAFEPMGSSTPFRRPSSLHINVRHLVAKADRSPDL